MKRIKAGYNDLVDQVTAAKLAMKRAVGTGSEPAAKANLQAKEQAATDYLDDMPED